ncbi:MAG: ATP-binding protein [Tannerellaceae bacterium]|jgi:anti-sigma regulatory factor (Ser/Thr protein kinase)|nr:ATP-binding protein [Tannerellaceae bacterium]
MADPLHIKNEIGQLARVNEYLRQAAGELALSASALMSLKLAVEEAVVNAILYAYPGEVDKDIFVRLDCNEEKVTVVITDYGRPFDLTASKDPDISLPLEERPVGGLGAFLVKQLMTEVSYRRVGNRNVLTMVKLIHP